MRSRGLEGSFVVAGRRVPVVIGSLIGLTFVLSILGALSSRGGVPLAAVGALVPALVLQGQVWRLVTWIFFADDPISLIFTLLMLWWFGQELLYVWGARRFLWRFLGVTVVAAVVTTLLSLVWPPLGATVYLGQWPVTTALLVAWAIQFPHRQMLAYLVLPIGGDKLIYLTLGGTLLFAIYFGLAPFVPHFVAQALALVTLRWAPLQRFLIQLRLARLQRQAHRGRHLREVPPRGRDEPPRWLH